MQKNEKSYTLNIIMYYNKGIQENQESDNLIIIKNISDPSCIKISQTTGSEIQQQQ